MDQFRVWLQPSGSRCIVRVEQLENAQRLRAQLIKHQGDPSPLEHVEDTPLYVFHVPVNQGLSLRHIREVVGAVPGAFLMRVPMRLRLTVAKGLNPAEELAYAARVRRDLWAHSSVEVDPDDPRNTTYRDAQRRAYFEITTDQPDEVRRVIEQHGHAERVTVSEAEEGEGPECLNCGNIVGPIFPTVCPNCEMREISPCPYCGSEVPRQLYASLGGDLFVCPKCKSRVRVQANSEPFAGDGTYTPPLFLVKRTG